MYDIVLDRRTRIVFDVVLRVHQTIQQRDLEVGRNLGNWILRWLDRMKPSAEIRAPPNQLLAGSRYDPKHLTSSSQPLTTQRPDLQFRHHGNKLKSFFSPSNLPAKSFPTIAMMMRPMKLAAMNHQYRHLSYYSPCLPEMQYRNGRTQGVFRRDIAQWMLQN
jgi:hypothetical protein